MSTLIGRVLATEKSPTTIDEFNFWTNSDLKLSAFDIVKVEHIDASYTFGVIENISHITDADSFLTNFISYSGFCLLFFPMYNFHFMTQKESMILKPYSLFCGCFLEVYTIYM